MEWISQSVGAIAEPFDCVEARIHQLRLHLEGRKVEKFGTAAYRTRSKGLAICKAKMTDSR